MGKLYRKSCSYRIAKKIYRNYRQIIFVVHDLHVVDVFWQVLSLITTFIRVIGTMGYEMNLSNEWMSIFIFGLLYLSHFVPDLIFIFALPFRLYLHCNATSASNFVQLKDILRPL